MTASLSDNAPGVRQLNFFATYRCNSRCSNCHIWKNTNPFPDTPELSDARLDALFAHPELAHLENVGFAGGEPTISPFFWRAVERVPQATPVTVTTNALAGREKLLALMERQPRPGRLCVQVSLDGLEETSDRLRGVPGGFAKGVSLLRQAHERGAGGLLSFTINRENFRELPSVYSLARSLNAEFSARLAYAGGAYDNEDNAELFALTGEELDEMHELLMGVVDTELARPEHNAEKAVFLAHIAPHARGELNERYGGEPVCRAMDSGLVMDLHGEVFANCPVLMQSLGNVRERDFSEVWRGEKAQAMRRKVAARACGGCWNDCQMLTNLGFDPLWLERAYLPLRLRSLPDTMPERIDWREDAAWPLALSGWYGLEGENDFRFRWCQGRASIVAPAGARGLRLSAAAHPGVSAEAPLTIEVLREDALLASLTLTRPNWDDMELPFAQPLQSASPLVLRLNTVFRPRDHAAPGESADGRDLGLAVRFIDFLR